VQHDANEDLSMFPWQQHDAKWVVN